MKTDLNYDFTTIESEEEQLEYLFGSLRHAFCDYSLSEWKDNLAALTNVVTSDTYEAEAERHDSLS